MKFKVSINPLVRWIPFFNLSEFQDINVGLQNFEQVGITLWRKPQIELAPSPTL